MISYFCIYTLYWDFDLFNFFLGIWRWCWNKSQLFILVTWYGRWVSHEDYGHRLMNGLSFSVFNITEAYFRDINEFSFGFFNTLVLTVCDSNLSHTGRVEGSIVSIKQEDEEVKWCCLLWNDLLFLFTLCITFNALHFCLIYTCPQLIKDVDHQLSGSNGFGNLDVKEECSSDFSNYSGNEGNPALHLYLLLYRIH